MSQSKQTEWSKQWAMFKVSDFFLFEEWIAPHTLEDFRDKDILECGCGNGKHTSFVASYARSIAAVDLNTAEIAKQQHGRLPNASFIEADIATMDLGRQFDVVFCIGVAHHTDDPDKTVQNLKKHVRPGGKLIIWVYSLEGNFLVKNLVEPARKAFFCRLDKGSLHALSRVITFFLYIPIYSLYLLPLKFLPYFEYFSNFRKLSFERNTLNVFDKLNAPQVIFIDKARVQGWFNEKDFREVHISLYKGVSWRASGTKRP